MISRQLSNWHMPGPCVEGQRRSADPRVEGGWLWQMGLVSSNEQHKKGVESSL